MKSVSIPTLVILAAAVFMSCGDESGTTAPARSPGEVVRGHILEIQEATRSGDFDTVLRYTHPCVIKQAGGEEEIRKLMEGAVAEILSTVEFKAFEFRGDPTFVEGTKNEFVIVPTRSVFGFGSKTISSERFQLGVRPVGGSDWRYIEAPEREFILENFPDFPADQTLPKSRMTPQ